MMINPVIVAIPVFSALIACEAWLSSLYEKGYYDSQDAWTNISLGLGSVVFNALFGVVTGIIYLFVYEAAPYKFPENAWWSWVLLFFVDDFAYYWFHRISHESRFFWNFHVVHHSSEHYNLSVAVRQSWFSGAAHWMFYAPVMLLGFAPWMFATMHGFNLLYQFWIHTKFVDRLGAAESVLNTPSHHRVHHGVNLEYLDRNYAGVLIIWDRLFGTFAPELEVPKYGITTPLSSHNPIWINTHAWVEMYDEIKKRPNLGSKLRCIFSSPYMDRP